MDNMGVDGSQTTEQYAPLVGGLYNGSEVLFIHRELRSVAEVKEAEESGEVTVTEPGIVVNFPVLVWPGGSR